MNGTVEFFGAIRRKLVILSAAQRAVIWVGIMILLACFLYPEFERGYEWNKMPIAVHGERMFILDGLFRNDNNMDHFPSFNPELRRIIDEKERQREDPTFGVICRLKGWNVVVQATALLLLVVIGVWTLRPKDAHSRGYSPLPPITRAWGLPKIRLSRRAMVGLVSTVGILGAIWGAWGLSRISRTLPADELAKLDGLCSSSSGVFSGEIYNGSESWTIREVTVRLTLQENSTAKSRDYHIRSLWIPPLETRRVSVDVLTPPGSESVPPKWTPIAGMGFKDFWNVTAKTSRSSASAQKGADPSKRGSVTIKLSDIDGPVDLGSGDTLLDGSPRADGLPPSFRPDPNQTKPTKLGAQRATVPAGKQLGGGWTLLDDGPAKPVDLGSAGRQPRAVGSAAEDTSAGQGQQERTQIKNQIAEAIDAYSLATPEERAILAPVLNKKLADGMPKLPPAMQQEVDDRLRKIPNAPRKAVPIDPCKSSSSTSGAESRPPNGSFYQPGEGHGTLNVTNGNADDAAVILASDSAQVTDRLVYIRAGTSATMNRIPKGTYRLMFQIGRTWDDKTETFKCANATGVFDSAAAFDEEEKSDRVEYTEISITLHKLIGGNARTSALPQSQFHRRRNAP
jgi:hypothetical protein